MLDAASYLAGMIDGEGSVTLGPTRKCRRVTIHNTDADLIEACEQCCEELGITFRTHQNRPVQRGWTIAIMGRDNLELLYTSVPIQHRRKRDLLREAVDTYQPRFIPPDGEELRRLYEQGATLSDLAELTGYHSRTVRKYLLLSGVELRGRSEWQVLGHQRRAA